MKLCVVIPIYNEEERLMLTLESLANQSDSDFALVLVDNGSIDNTQMVISKFQEKYPSITLHTIHESQKGTGAASDTGCRYAIEQGYSHIARTDADCIVHVDWVYNIKQAFQVDGLEFVGGIIKPREDEYSLTVIDRIMIPTLLVLADVTGAIRRRGREFKYPYIMVAGNNLAISAKLYEKSGGFPRTAIEQLSEDRVLSESVRKLTSKGARVHNVIVYNSVRRLRSYGYLKTILWYLDLWKNPHKADIR